MFGGEFEGGEETKYWLDSVNCVGDEDHLFACRHRGLGNVHHEGCRGAARVTCGT